MPIVRPEHPHPSGHNCMHIQQQFSTTPPTKHRDGIIAVLDNLSTTYHITQPFKFIYPPKRCDHQDL